MQSYGTYTEEQQVVLKARNKDLVGHMRHYDEIVSHGKNRHVCSGFIAGRDYDKAIRKEYYQKIDGSMWGLGDIEVVKLALNFKSEGDEEALRTDWVVGAAPPGYHLPQWEREVNVDFEPIQAEQ